MQHPIYPDYLYYKVRCLTLSKSGSLPGSTSLFLPATEIGPPRLSTPVRLCLALWSCRFSEMYKYATSIPLFSCPNTFSAVLHPQSDNFILLQVADAHTMILTISTVGILALGTLSVALSVKPSPRNALSQTHIGIEDGLEATTSCVIDKPVVAHHMVGCVLHPYGHYRYCSIMLTLP